MADARNRLGAFLSRLSRALLPLAAAEELVCSRCVGQRCRRRLMPPLMPRAACSTFDGRSADAPDPVPPQPTPQPSPQPTPQPSPQPSQPFSSPLSPGFVSPLSPAGSASTVAPGAAAPHAERVSVTERVLATLPRRLVALVEGEREAGAWLLLVARGCSAAAREVEPQVCSRPCVTPCSALLRPHLAPPRAELGAGGRPAQLCAGGTTGVHTLCGRAGDADAAHARGQQAAGRAAGRAQAGGAFVRGAGLQPRVEPLPPSQTFIAHVERHRGVRQDDAGALVAPRPCARAPLTGCAGAAPLYTPEPVPGEALRLLGEATMAAVEDAAASNRKYQHLIRMGVCRCCRCGSSPHLRASTS